MALFFPLPCISCIENAITLFALSVPSNTFLLAFAKGLRKALRNDTEGIMASEMQQVRFASGH
jgi:hypothetical protein